MKYFLPFISVFLLSSCIVDTKTVYQKLEYDFESNGLAFNVLKNSYNNEEVEVTASTKPSSYSGSIIIPSEVTYNGTDYTVLEIGYRAFYESAVYEITIPPSIEEVQEYAFEKSNLKNLIIKDDSFPLAVTHAFYDAPIETAYIGRSISGLWENKTLNEITLGKEVKRFSIILHQPLKITCNSEIPPVINIEAPEEVFNNSIVYVPGNSMETYATDKYWRDFKIILASE